MAYCTTDDVISLFPRNISSKLTDDTVMIKVVTTADITKFISWADNQINSAISILYRVPIKKIITVNADNTSSHDFPEPIRILSSLIAAHLTYQKLFAESQNPDAIPKYGENYMNSAMNHINAIRSGAIVLKGQRLLGKRYLRQESRDAPKLPFKFEDYKGGTV